MPTATTKTKTATEQLVELEAEREEIRQRLRTQRHEHSNTAKSTEELTNQRRRLAHRNPGLVDHTGSPVGGDENPVAVLDAELKKLANVDDLYAKAGHTARLEQVADAKVREFIEVHGIELLAEFNEQEEGAAATEFISTRDAFRIAGERIFSREHRREQLGAERNDSLVASISHVLSMLEGIEVGNG